MISLGFLVLLPVFVGLWLLRPDLRRQMVWAGTLSLPILLVGPLVSIGYFGQLTNQQLIVFFLSRALLSFALGAIASAVYEVVFSRRLKVARGEKREQMFWVLLGLIAGVLGYLFFDLSLVAAVALSVACSLLIVILIRPDLLVDALFSAVVMAALYIVLAIVGGLALPGDLVSFWFSNTLSGLTLSGFPIEELVTIALFGALWGPLYVAVKGMREVPNELVA